jgi:hypothetical protein
VLSSRVERTALVTCQVGSPFVQLLWGRGTAFERETIDALTLPYLDLSIYSGDEKERQTVAAMQRGEPLIYSGRIRVDDLLGDPDVLRREGTGCVAGDIKSGSGEEGPEDLSKPKAHYAARSNDNWTSTHVRFR